MLNRLLEAVIKDEDAKSNVRQRADGAMFSSNVNTYKRLSGIPEGSFLSDDDKSDLTNSLKSVKLSNGQSRETQLEAVLKSVK